MSLKPYPEYKDSSIEWLGQLPVHWQRAEVSRLGKIRLGKMLQVSSTSPDDSESDYLSAISIQDSGLSLSSIKKMWVSPRDRRQLSLEKGDVLVVEGGSVGRSVHLKVALPELIFQNAINRVRAFPRVADGRFIDYALKALVTSGVMELVCNKATIMHLTAEKLGKLAVAMPPLEEQMSICEYLDRETAEIDAFIADQEELIVLLNERREATITQAVTKGLDPTAPMKDSGIDWLGAVPTGWTVSPLKWSCNLVTGITPSTSEDSYYSDFPGSFQWIRPEDVDESGVATRGSKYLSVSGITQVRALPSQTVLLVCIGATLGKVGISDAVSATNQQLTALVSTSYLGMYLFFAMQSARVEIELSATGTTMPIINNSRLGTIAIPCPPRREQSVIVEYLKIEIAEIDATIADAMEAIALSKERRAALISAAVTGKIDVRNSMSLKQQSLEGELVVH